MMRSLLFSIFAFIAPFIATTTAAQTTCAHPYSVGYRVSTVAGMRVAMWYPTLAAATTYAYTGKMSGVVALNAAPACGPVPLIVFSHGLGGCGTQSLFFTEELARHGYVVAAPDHDDATFCTVDGGTGDPANMIPQEPLGQPALWSDATYADRKDDLEDLIDALIVDPTFGPTIDAAAIGAAGHSLGGYTVIGLAGGWPTWKDARIKAVLAMSPYVLPFELQQTLATLHVPVMYQGAQLDIGVTPFLEGPNGAYAQSSTPKYLAILHGGTHFVWTNAACGKAGSVQRCLARRDPRMIDLYGIAFLDTYLKELASPVLAGNGAGLAAYVFSP